MVFGAEALLSLFSYSNNVVSTCDVRSKVMLNETRDDYSTCAVIEVLDKTRRYPSHKNPHRCENGTVILKHAMTRCF